MAIRKPVVMDDDGLFEEVQPGDSVDSGTPVAPDIITHRLNDQGRPLTVYDPASSSYRALGPLVVVDNAGNVVTA